MAPPDIAKQVWTQSGGHPFLAQYLYHHLWLRHQQVAVDASTIDDLVRQFYSERSKDVEGWVNVVEATGLTVYGSLDKHGQRITEEEFAARLPQSAQTTKRGLTALCYHGLATHESWQRYRRAGALFQTWFVQYAIGTNGNVVGEDAPYSGRQSGDAPRKH